MTNEKRRSQREKNANTLGLQRNAKVTEKGFQTSGFDNLNGNNRKDEGLGSKGWLGLKGYRCW